MTAAQPRHNERLQSQDVLVGEWDMQASIDGQPMAQCKAIFRWHDSHGYLTMRVDPPTSISPQWRDHSPFPVDAAFGLDEHSGAFAMLYSDARGVCRIYRMSFDDGRWEMSGQAGPGFYQRFEATISDDGRLITARWDGSGDGQRWTPDFDVTYTKQ